MAELKIGVRDLKANLSEYLAKAKKGQTIVITSHGEVIAQLTPHKEDLLDRVQSLQSAGLVAWSGKKPRRKKPSAVNTSGKLVSDLVSELRE
jgi:prevent-host-death family protein